ncbi:MAG: sulfatase family protein [Pirellulales bacterium]
MNRIFLPLLSVCLLSSTSFAVARKPNVIVIFTDDQGSVDAGCYGTKDIKTPGIDRLAERGVRFTQFYSASAVCSPSRAGLLTGRYPLRAGLTGNASSTHGADGGMASEQVSMAEMFKASGYKTAHIGKWHLGYVPEKMPLGQGFDYSFGHMGGCIDNYSHFFYWQGPNRHDLWRNGEEIQLQGRFFPDLMVEEASEFMTANKENPFFIYFAMNTPHYPYQGDADWLAYYDKQKVKYPRNLYNAFVSTLDARIDKLVSKIDSLGLKDDTIIIYQSDHGHSTEERAHRGGGSSGPYRGHKFSLFEGGIRVPAIISWPGHLPQNEVRGQMAHGCDWMATVSELCGVKLVNPDIDGKSIVAVCKSNDAASPHQVTHWQMGNGPNAQWAVRHGSWKLLGNSRAVNEGPPLAAADKKLFLANLAQDVSELKNLASSNPDKVAELLKLREAWLKSATAE